MKTVTTVLAIAALCICAWAADNTTVAPATQIPSTKPQTPNAETDGIAIPQVLSYQGRLTDASGKPVADGSYAIRFRLYAQPDGGRHFWEETQSVTTRDGLFSVLLAAVKPIATGWKSEERGTKTEDGRPGTGTALYLGMAVEGDAEMLPRLRITGAGSADLSKPEEDGRSPRLGTDADDAWVRIGTDSVLYTIRRLGLVRGGSSNVLYGTYGYTQTIFGSSCTTGASGSNVGNIAIGGGYGNRAWAPFTAVCGGRNNKAGDAATDTSAIVVGGYGNRAIGKFSAVIAGQNNIAGGEYSTVPGGYGDTCAGDYGMTGGYGTRTRAAADYTYAFGENCTTSTPRAVVFYHSGGATKMGVGVQNPTVNLHVAGTGRFSSKLVAASGYKADSSVADSQWVTKRYVDTHSGGAGDSATGSFAVTTDLRVYGKGRIGPGNSNAGTAAFVAGTSNSAVGNYSSVAGGADNSAGYVYAFVGGGSENFAGDTGVFIGGGAVNSASGNYSSIVGGFENSVNGFYAAVGGGSDNSVTGYNSVIAGGANNSVGANLSTIAGGTNNAVISSSGFGFIGGGESDTVAGQHAAVVAGLYNNASGSQSFVGSGRQNKATQSNAAVVAGNYNVASGSTAIIGGGALNLASGGASMVGCGGENVAAGEYSSVTGGRWNRAGGDYSFVGGGESDTASGRNSGALSGYRNVAVDTTSVVCGGDSNRATGKTSFVGGGRGNTSGTSGSFVGAGLRNRAESRSVVGGGANDSALGNQGFIGGGAYNKITSGVDFGVIGGGRDDSVSGDFATIGGGEMNNASHNHATVGGGYHSTASGERATVAGGSNNYASGTYATIAGGMSNAAAGRNASVGGGEDNAAGDEAADSGAVVAGGWDNAATNKFAVVVGGRADTANGYYSGVLSGLNNKVGRWYDSCSVIAGGVGNRIGTDSAPFSDGSSICGGVRNTVGSSRYATIAGGYKVTLDDAEQTLAFGDSFTTTTSNAVVFCHTGQTTKVGIGVPNPTHWIDVSGGAYCNGTNWVNSSSRALKRDISELSADELRQVLAQLDQTQVVRYQYKSEESGEEHIGVIAEDAPEAITTPERDGVNTGDAIGWLIAVAKAQQAEIEALKAELKRR